MKQHPILFSTPMVQAILQGNKTMTRRVVKVIVEASLVGTNPFTFSWIASENGIEAIGRLLYLSQSPYGKVGDVLWVRESFTVLEPEHCIGGMKSRFIYKANMNPDSEEIRQDYIKCGYPYKWKPSIHMPKEACRLFLQITNIRVERLQEISEDDAINEGIENLGKGYSLTPWKDYLGKGGFVATRTSFFTLWSKINGINSWNSNPWVWVIEFKQIAKP